jgi:hypothetical protein
MLSLVPKNFKILTILVPTVLTACGLETTSTTNEAERGDQIRKVEAYTPDANQLLTTFNNDAIQHGIVINPERLASIKIQFARGQITGEGEGEGIENAIGVCSWYDNLLIVRLPEYWPYEYPSTDRFYRVFAHEAGHCLLNLLHSDDDAIVTINNKQIKIPGASRIMASRESELNRQFNSSMWPALKADLYSYARQVADNKVDGIEDAEGLGLDTDHTHNGGCVLLH